MKYFSVFLVGAILLAAGIYAVDTACSNALFPASAQELRTVILDAGHGGEDGGAVSDDGTPEKDINLAMTKKIACYFDFFGITYIPVRTDDISVCDEGLDTVRKRKYSDIMNRAALTDSVENSVFLSIHQNYFPEKQYSGTQTFYSNNTDDSRVLAQSIQTAVVSSLQPENQREIKPSGSEIYLLYNAKTTSVLVECGFMSNDAELAKLKDDTYQKQLSYFIFRGTLNFLSDKKDV